MAWANSLYASCLLLGTVRPPLMFVFLHREVENTISVDRPVVSALVLMCEKIQRLTFPHPGRGHRGGGGESGYWQRRWESGACRAILPC